MDTGFNIIYYSLPILYLSFDSVSHTELVHRHAKHQAERQRPPHLPGQNITNEQGTYDPEVIKKFHCNVAEAQLELHRQEDMEWCIGTIAKARNRHVDVETDRGRRSTRPDLVKCQRWAPNEKFNLNPTLFLKLV